MDVTRPPGELGIDDRQWDLLLSTYESCERLVIENETLGERRLQTLLTVIGAAGVAVGLVADQVTDEALLMTAAAASGLVTLLGFLTTMRVAQRDAKTSGHKADLHRLRRYVADGDEGLLRALPHATETAPQLRQRPWYPSRGGLVEFVGVLTATFGGIASLAATYTGYASVVAGLAVGLAAAIGLWVLQIWAVRGIYARAECLGGTTRGRSDRPATTFRAGVGIVVRDSHARVLVLERRDHPGSWQFPQGGIERGEVHLSAALRELEEETGLRSTDVSPVLELQRWLAYELPEALRSESTGLGQVQRWYLFQTNTDDVVPGPFGRQDSEFMAAEWVSFDEAVHRAVGFKRHVYETLYVEFSASTTGL